MIKNQKKFSAELLAGIVLFIVVAIIWAVLLFPDFSSSYKNNNDILSHELENREAAFADSFYNSDPTKLKEEVKKYLSYAKIHTDKTPKAIIVPHAGLGYSGPIAAIAYAQLIPVKDKIKKIVVIGPSHNADFAGIALSSAQRWTFPLGSIRIDQPQNRKLLDFPFVRTIDKVHANEYSVETQLPFIYEVFGSNVMLTPVVVGRVSDGEMSAFINKIWGGEETLIIVTSDLSHYLPYKKAQQIDALTAQSIEMFNFFAITPKTACGHIAIKGLLLNAGSRNAEVKTLDLRNSGDTFLKRDSVVGYGAFGVFEPKELPIIAEQKEFERILKKHGHILLKVAAKSIKNGFENGEPLKVNPKNYPEELQRSGASFVTINKTGSLRGCMGSVVPKGSIVEDVAVNAFQAAFFDRRFKRLKQSEFSTISLQVSLLTPPYPINFSTEEDLITKIKPNEDGLILSEVGGKEGIFLPTVWNVLPERRDFLNELKIKAGLEPYYWSPTIKINRFLSTTISESDFPGLGNLWY